MLKPIVKSIIVALGILHFWKRFASLALAALMGVGLSLPAAAWRSGVYWGYFAQDAAHVHETYLNGGYSWSMNNSNLYWSTGSTDDTKSAIQNLEYYWQYGGTQYGRRIVIQMSGCNWTPANAAANTKWWFDTVFYPNSPSYYNGKIDGVIAVSWCDEPDTSRNGSWSDADATAMSAAVRQGLAQVPWLQMPKLAVIYACATGSHPGIASFDWVGCDDYDSGDSVFANYVDNLPISGSQRLFAVIAGSRSPGGGWQLNPQYTLDHVFADPRYVAIVAFAWQTLTDGGTYLGIREDDRMYYDYTLGGYCVTSANYCSGYLY